MDARKQSGKCNVALLVVLIGATLLGVFKFVYPQVDLTEVLTVTVTVAVIAAVAVCALIKRLGTSAGKGGGDA